MKCQFCFIFSSIWKLYHWESFPWSNVSNPINLTTFDQIRALQFNRKQTKRKKAFHQVSGKSETTTAFNPQHDQCRWQQENNMRAQHYHHHHHHNHGHQHNQQSTSSWFTRVRLRTTRVDLNVALSRHSENVPLNIDVVPEITMQMKIYPDVQKMRRKTTNEMKIYPDICKRCITSIKIKTT